MRFLLLLLLPVMSFAQSLPSHAYGDKRHPPVIFLHGGPGSNSINFESTTAQLLADQGFYVITYDRRGEGRASGMAAQYTFQQSFDDLNAIMREYHLPKATVIGFSFGGIVATLFADKYPEKVQSLVLVSALVDVQATYSTIIESCSDIYRKRKDSAGLQDLAALQKLDRGSQEFRRGCFRQASRNGFFATPHRDSAAVEIYKRLDTDTLYQQYAAKSNDAPVSGFWQNEHYSMINNIPVLQRLKKSGMPIFAIYGKDDGLFSVKQIAELERITGAKNARLAYFDHAAHYLYNDQQQSFLHAFSLWKAKGGLTAR
ncbi:alpha/beta hydrolase [Chitinophaga dinghuensis]|nr:alpha/beta hydrolase [Chitinophaga dinghuensis]